MFEFQISMSSAFFFYKIDILCYLQRRLEVLCCFKLTSGLPDDRPNWLLGIVVMHKQRSAAVSQTVAQPAKTWMYAERTEAAASAGQERKAKALVTTDATDSIASPTPQVLIFSCLFLLHI